MTQDEINKFMGWFAHPQPDDPASLVVRVRMLVAAAVAAEREACAAMVKPLDESLAEAIRVRGNT